MSFGYKQSWLAVRYPDAQAVLEALLIDDAQPANWRTGLMAIDHGHTFVSPSLLGWVFVVSENLPTLISEETSQDWAQLMESLASQFSEVQFFGTHRVVEYHAWARFVDGIEQRAYAYAGEYGDTLVNRGQQTPGEIELGHGFFDERSPEAKSAEYWEREDLRDPDKEDVVKVAGKWSLNPNTLDELDVPPGVGWIGVIRTR